MKKYDFILIGTGQATGTILPGLLEISDNVAIVEADKTGGTCVNWGCTPTKTFVASARDAHMVRRAGDFGVSVSDFSIDFSRVMDRVNGIRNEASAGMESWLRELTDFYAGEASFVDEHTIKVGEETLFGEKIIIHTGTRARRPDIEGVDSVPWLDNRGVLAMDELPEHLLVVGGSYIGLEFAQAYRRFGSKVTVVTQGDRLVTREDPEVSAATREILSDEGVVFEFNAELKGLESIQGGVQIQYTRDGKDQSLQGSHVLIAIGRVPNTDTLNLSAAGVETNKRGFITVNEETQTSVPHIYALGDVNGKGAFTHTSVHDGQVFLSQLKGGTKKISDRTMIYSMYIDPPLARVGMSESDARRSGKSALVAVRNMSAINRAREKDETNGLVKLIVEKDTGLLLGGTIFGVGGDEIIGMLALAIQANVPFSKFEETVLPHPTVSELIPWIFADLQPITS